MTVVGLNVGYADYKIETEVLAKAGIVFEHHTSIDDIADKSAVEALMVRQVTIDAAMMDMFPALKMVQRYGVGVDNVDLDAATARGVRVCNTPDYGQAYEVSDHAVALFLALSRRLLTRDRDVRSGVWGVDQAQPILGHRGATLGLVGYGRIAKETWSKFRALGLSRCLVSDPALSAADAESQGVEIASIEDICRQADVISLHCPLLAGTHHIIDEKMLGLMKASSFIINVSRGGLIDERALAEALNSGSIAGAGLDVFEQEPPDPASSLFSAPNTILTDHLAWYSEATVKNLQTTAAEEVVRVLLQDAPSSAVNV